MLGTFRPDALEFEEHRHDQAVAPVHALPPGGDRIEYALLSSGVALVIVTAVGTVGTQLGTSFTHIAGAFP